jgi:hypothetical protein
MTERKFSKSFEAGPFLINPNEIKLLLRIKKLEEKNSNQRRELRRLNASQFKVKFLESRNRELEQEVLSLATLLDRDDEENADTDPSQILISPGEPHPDLGPIEMWDTKPQCSVKNCKQHNVEEDNFPVNSSTGTVVSINQSVAVGRQETYEEWDMRTRYPNLPNRRYQ